MVFLHKASKREKDQFLLSFRSNKTYFVEAASSWENTPNAQPVYLVLGPEQHQGVAGRDDCWWNSPATELSKRKED